MVNGLIFDCFEKCVMEQYGADTWVSILQHAFHEEEEKKDSTLSVPEILLLSDVFRTGQWKIGQKYPDSFFFRLAQRAAIVLKIDLETLVENVGYFFFDYIR
jgi:hypothetical protein